MVFSMLTVTLHISIQWIDNLVFQFYLLLMKLSYILGIDSHKTKFKMGVSSQMYVWICWIYMKMI